MGWERIIILESRIKSKNKRGLQIWRSGMSGILYYSNGSKYIFDDGEMIPYGDLKKTPGLYKFEENKYTAYLNFDNTLLIKGDRKI